MPNKTDEVYFGQLNNIRKQPFRRRVETNSNNSLKSIRDATREVLYDNNLNLQGEFNGYVIKKVKSEKDTISQIRNMVSGWIGSDLNIRQYKVRVPEVHSMIPMPQGEDDCIRGDMHDTFEVIDENFQELEPGNIVRVSFYDNNGNYNPIIKKYINKGNGIPEVETTKEKFEPQVQVDNIAAPDDVPIDSGRKSPIEPPREYNPPPDTNDLSDLELLERLFDKWGVENFEASETIKHKGQEWRNYGGERLTVPPKNLWTNIRDTILVADRIRNEWKRRGYKGGVIISSGYRAPYYNDEIVEGEEDSQHKVYKALDIRPKTGPYKEFVRVCEEQINILRSQGVPTGMGIYPGKSVPFVHIDTNSDEGQERRWTAYGGRFAGPRGNRTVDYGSF